MFRNLIYETKAGFNNIEPLKEEPINPCLQSYFLRLEERAKSHIAGFYMNSLFSFYTSNPFVAKGERGLVQLFSSWLSWTLEEINIHFFPFSQKVKSHFLHIPSEERMPWNEHKSPWKPERSGRSEFTDNSSWSIPFDLCVGLAKRGRCDLYAQVMGVFAASNSNVRKLQHTVKFLNKQKQTAQGKSARYVSIEDNRTVVQTFSCAIASTSRHIVDPLKWSMKYRSSQVLNEIRSKSSVSFHFLRTGENERP